MSVESAFLRMNNVLSSSGRMGLNMLFPREFELYMCALELIDDKGKTLRYFIFPTMPTNIDETKTKITSVRQTLKGTVTLRTPVFVPRDITISGTFGRKLRLLLGDLVEDVVQSGNLLQTIKGEVMNFDERVKTGYGCIKILEEIIESVDDVSRGLKTLIFHNPAIGNSYVVNPMNLKLSQTQETNMIWNYSLAMKGIAPIESLDMDPKKENRKLLLKGFFQKGVNNLLDNVTMKK